MPDAKIRTPKRLSLVRHQDEYMRQILLPILGVALAFSALIAWLAYAGMGGGGVNLANLSDISLIWLMLPMLLLALIVLALMVASIYGMGVLLGKAPRYTGKAQKFVYKYTDLVRETATRITRPLIKLRAWADYLGNRKKA